MSPAVTRTMSTRPDIETELLTLRTLRCRRMTTGWTSNTSFRSGATRLFADGLIIVVPEYNHGYPGSLKSVLDLLLKEYVHKAVALVGVSAGAWGGTRVIEAMVPMVRELGLVVTFTDLHFPLVKSKFDESGNLLDDAYTTRVHGFLDEVVWMSRTLKWGRVNLPSKHHPTI